MKLDINDSNDIRIKVKYLNEVGGNEYETMIYTVSATDIKMDTKYFEFNFDADTNVTVEINTKGAAAIQVQVQVGTLGSPAAIILADSEYLLAY